MTRAQWKFVYRLYRIVRRETAKAAEDMLIFGTGCVEYGLEIPDCVRYVPFSDLKERLEPQQ